MKWLFLTVLVLVAGGVAAFAIYTFGWRDSEQAGDRARADLDARELCRGCQPKGLKHRAGSVWEVYVRGSCFLIDVERFSLREQAGVIGC
jgi:hypothetical protein